MKLLPTKEFKKNYEKLPKDIQKRIDKQLKYLSENYRHPSLKSRKMSGYKSVYEIRVTKGYRMRFLLNGQEAHLLVVGPHDFGLGKK